MAYAPLKKCTLGCRTKTSGVFMIDTARRLHNAASGNLGADYRLGFSGLGAECDAELAKRFGPPQINRTFYVPQDVLEYRVMSTIPGAKGGYLVGASIESFVDQLKNASSALALGAQIILHSGGGNVTLVKQVSGQTFYWIIAGTGATASDAAFGQLTATPHIAGPFRKSLRNCKTTKLICRICLRRNLALGLGASVEQALVSGAARGALGVSNTPELHGGGPPSLARRRSTCKNSPPTRTLSCLLIHKAIWRHRRRRHCSWISRNTPEWRRRFGVAT